MTLLDFVRACVGEDAAVAAGEAPAPIPHPTAEYYARLRAECEAKQRVIRLYVKSADRTVAHGAPSNAEIRTAALADVVQIIAQPYADRPGWCEEWRL